MSGKKDEPKTGKLSDVDREAEFHLFPERRGQQSFEPSLFKKLVFGVRSSKIEKFKCEQRLKKCIDNHPLVKLLIEAMDSAGCNIDFKRHFTCEYCGPEVTGGYDAETNQVVCCYNKLTTTRAMGPVMTHELIHMYDNCRAKFDIMNIEHIACSEIRAANLAHCSFLGSMSKGTTSPFRIANTHRDCVKLKAAQSLLAARPSLSNKEVFAVVDKVFDRCYGDLEPIGRRVRSGSKDMDKAYRERRFYNYY